MKEFRSASLLLLALACGTTSSAQGAPSAAGAGASVGRTQVRTLSLGPDMVPRSGTYTPSGKVLVSYQTPGNSDPRQVNLAVVDDDGRNARTIFSQRLPERPKDNGVRFMVFSDNRRVFLGDFILEYAPSLEACAKSIVDLNTQKEWVFHSPMSWRPDSKKGLWVEGLRGRDARRIQLVELPDYQPGPVVKASPRPM